MRSIGELMQKFKDVWFYVDDEQRESFVEQCEICGYTFHNGDHLTLDRCGSRMALQLSDKTVWYVAGICWYYSFSSPDAVINISNGSRGPSPRINFKAYTSGDPCYVYKSHTELVEP